MTTKTLAIAAATLAFALSPLAANAAGLTDTQVSAILGLLQSFGADATVIANVTAALHGSAPIAPAASGNADSDGMNSRPPGGLLCPLLLHALKRGDSDSTTGGEVSKLQQFLRDAGFLSAAANGNFGPATQQAVLKFQQENSVAGGDGTIVGPGTRAAFLKHCRQPSPSTAATGS